MSKQSAYRTAGQTSRRIACNAGKLLAIAHNLEAQRGHIEPALRADAQRERDMAMAQAAKLDDLAAHERRYAAGYDRTIDFSIRPAAEGGSGE